MTEIVAGGLLLVISHRLPFFFAFFELFTKFCEAPEFFSVGLLCSISAG